MPEKYFATIVHKTPIGENDYFYSVDSVIAGDIDEDTRVLTSTSGEKYKPINDFTDYDQTTEYYANYIEVDQITNIFNQKYDFSEAIRQYEIRQRQVVYVATKLSEESYILLPVDKGPYIKVLRKIKSNPNAYPGEDLTVITPAEQEKMDMADDDENSEFISDIKALVSDVIAGKFSPDELIDIKYRLKEQRDEIDSAIDSINLQSESLEEELDKITGNKEQPIVPTPTPLKRPEPSQTASIHIDEIFDKVTKVLIAKDEPARRTIVELSRLDDMRKKDYGILLTGESGVGKTLLMSLLAKHINRPLLLIDSTQLTAPGYVGKSVEQYLWELYEDCGKDKSLAERAIVYFDEIDKKGSEKKTDISGQAVLNTLLKFLDGVTYTAVKNPQVQKEDNTVRISTENMITVAGGAFLDVYNQKKKTPIGFLDSCEDAPEQKQEPEISDFVDKAMMTKEFMGRVPVIIHLNDLDVDSIRRILLDSDESALKLQEEVFGKRGVKLTTKDGYILSISQQALDRKIGARGLKKLIADSTWKAYDDVCSHPGQYEEVILTEETAHDPKAYQLVKKRNNQ